MKTWSSMADHSLIRLFIIEFIDNTNGPYSLSIYDTVVELISQPAAKDALSQNPLKIVQFLSEKLFFYPR